MRRNIALSVLLVVVLSGCGAFRRGPSPGPTTDREITRVIAIAGAVAIEGKAAYQDGTIPPREEYKRAVNALGLSYEEARHVYLQYLDAKAEYAVALALVAGCDQADRVCLDAAVGEAERREAAMLALLGALQRAVADLPAHIERVKQILGRG